MRQLRFMTLNREIMRIDFGTMPSRGSNNYPRLYISQGTRKNFEICSLKGKSIMQMGEGWIPVELRDLSFQTLNPKDGKLVGVNVIPGILSGENPLTIGDYVYYNSWFGGPTSSSSCDGRSPLHTLPIFQNIEGEWYQVYPEWDSEPAIKVSSHST